LATDKRSEYGGEVGERERGKRKRKREEMGIK